MGIPENFACLFIIISDIAYLYGSLIIRPFFNESKESREGDICLCVYNNL
jgi:hypothetical protein